MLSLDQIKKKLRTLIVKEPGQVFEAIKTEVPLRSKKMEMLMLLQGRYEDLVRKAQKGIISSTDQSVETSQIREQLLLWIDSLEEKDLRVETVEAKKRKSHSLGVLLTVLLLAVLMSSVWYWQPFGSKEKEVPTGLDTVETATVQPADVPESSPSIPDQNSTTPQEKPSVAERPVEATKNEPKTAPAIQLKINVLPLWIDSDIMVDGERVEPLERVGTYISLALSPGTHKVRLVSGQVQCEKNILVREGMATLPFVCD